jgi:hypothetical protein
MNWRLLATSLIICFFIFRAAAAEELTCGTDKAHKEGGGEEHALTLVLTSNQITGLTYSNVTSNGEEGGDFACELILKDGTPESEWIRSGKKIKVIDKEPGEESFVEIEIPANGEYKVILKAVSAYHCGLGAVFPEYVVLKKSNRKCLINGQ